MKIISVFGSSQPQPGQPAYQTAYELGQRLAQAGFAAATGGYIGTMEAVSRGASEAGGHVIGVACDEIEVWRPVKPNQWIDEEIRYATLRERVNHLVTRNTGMIALPGGVGTLAEVAQAWSQLQVGVIPYRPLLLLGQLWRRTFEAFVDPLYVPADHRALLRFVDTPQEAVRELVEWVAARKVVESHPSGGAGHANPSPR